MQLVGICGNFYLIRIELGVKNKSQQLYMANPKFGPTLPQLEFDFIISFRIKTWNIEKNYQDISVQAQLNANLV